MNQLFTIIRRHWIPLLGLNTVLLAATIYAATVGIDYAPTWNANAKLNLPQQTDNLDVDLGTLGSLRNTGIGFSREVNPLQLQLTILTSDVVLERVRAVDPEVKAYRSLNSYRQLFTVTPQQLSTMLFLEVKGSSPELAQERLNTLLEVYQQRLNELRIDDANVREQFVQDEMQKARANLNQAQTSLTNFQKSTGLTDIAEQTKALVAALSQLRTAQNNIVAQAQAQATQAQEAAASLGMTPQQAINSLRLGENRNYQSIKQKVSEVEIALAEARGTYTDQSPQVQTLLQRRQELRSALNQQIAAAIPGANAAEVDSTLGGIGGGRDSRLDIIAELVGAQTTAKGLQQQGAQMQKQIDQLSSELNSISTNRAQLTELQRRYDIADGVYRGILAQIQQAKTNPFNVYPNVQTIDAPTIDPRPVAPKRWIVVFGGVLAAISGSVALILFLESRNPLLRPKDLQQAEFPVLGRISRLKRPDFERNLGTESELEFQRLAAAVLMLENNRLMVTSSNVGEGKTTVTLGLALALVNFGFRVLVVDGDLRQAQLSRRLGQSPTQRKAHAEPLRVTIHPGLDLMPAPAISKDKVAEFFARGSFERDLREMQAAGGYDYVLVDSPPVGLTSETSLMSAVMRNILFVVRSGTSDRYSVLDSFEQLARHNARIMGLVVNGVESRTEGYRYGRQRELQETEV